MMMDEPAEARRPPEPDRRPFYVVWSPEGGNPVVRFGAFEPAKHATWRLSERHTGQSFFVLKSCWGRPPQAAEAPADRRAEGEGGGPVVPERSPGQGESPPISSSGTSRGPGSSGRGEGRGVIDEPESDLPPGLGKPALRALGAAGYTRLGQLTAITEADLRKLHGVGPKAIGLIRDALSARGLSFSETDDG
jgi:hypothetical protein